MKLPVFLVVLLVAFPASAAPVLQEGFDTASALNTDIFDTQGARCVLTHGRLVLYYSSSQKKPAAGVECRLPSAPAPDIREMDFHFAGGGSEMSNSMFISYAVGPGRGLALPSLPEGNLRNDRSGYIVRYIRHGDGTNEIKLYRIDEGWDKELHHESLPANPLTTLRRTVIRHGSDGVHEITTTLDTGAGLFERTIVIRDATHPPGNDHRFIHWSAKGHSHITALLDIALDTWTVRDAKSDRLRTRAEGKIPKPPAEPADPSALQALAIAEMDRSELSDARRHLESARVALERGGEDEQRQLPHVLALLASVYASKDARQAARLYDQALALARKHAGPPHPDLGRIYSSLGNFQMSQKQFQKAEMSFRESIGIYQKMGPRFDRDRAETSRLLAILYLQHLSRPRDARRVLMDGISFWEKFEPQSLLAADALYKMAETYRVDKMLPPAETYYLKALAIQERFIDTDPTAGVNTLQHLAQISRLVGRYDASEGYFKRVESILTKTMGPRHPRLAAAKNNFANLYVDLKRYAEAETLYIEALEILEQDVGLNHSLVVKVCDRLSKLYVLMNRPADAQKYREIARRAGRR